MEGTFYHDADVPAFTRKFFDKCHACRRLHFSRLSAKLVSTRVIIHGSIAADTLQAVVLVSLSLTFEIKHLACKVHVEMDP
jgi:hypothetical protein